MALQDLLGTIDSQNKIGISEERLTAILPSLRQYVAFWREYPDLMVDFFVKGTRTEYKKGDFRFYFY